MPSVAPAALVHPRQMFALPRSGRCFDTGSALLSNHPPARSISEKPGPAEGKHKIYALTPTLSQREREEC